MYLPAALCLVMLAGTVTLTLCVTISELYTSRWSLYINLLLLLFSSILDYSDLASLSSS